MKDNTSKPDPNSPTTNPLGFGILFSIFTINLTFVFLSYYLNGYFLIIPALSSTFLFLDWSMNIKHKIQTHKYYKLISLGLKFKKLKKQAKSLNHSQVLISKFCYGLPIQDDESELQS